MKSLALTFLSKIFNYHINLNQTSLKFLICIQDLKYTYILYDGKLIQKYTQFKYLEQISSVYYLSALLNLLISVILRFSILAFLRAIGRTLQTLCSQKALLK